MPGYLLSVQWMPDASSLVTLAHAWPGVDADAVFMYGFSRGGMMTYLALKHGAPVRAAAVIGAPGDLMRGLEQRPEMEEVYREVMPDYARGKEAHLVPVQARLRIGV